jgi:hypothetical protein
MGGMGLYVRQDEQRTKLQEKIAADLRAKAAERAKRDIEGPVYDGEKDASIVEDTHKSSPLLAVWIGLGVATVAVVVYLIIRSS